MKAFNIFVILFPILLAACSISQNITPTPLQTSLIPLSQTIGPNSTQFITPTVTLEIPTYTAMPSPFPTITIASPLPYPTPLSSPTLPLTAVPSPIPTLEAPGELDRKDAVSLVRWLRYGLEYQDLAYIKPLMADEIWYSLYATDNPGEKISKETFLSELERRLPNHPSCMAYHAQQGVIKYLVISTEGWSPPWEFEKREYGTMVFSFSDQWTKSEGLYLFGAFVSRPRPGLDFNELPCR